MYGDSAGAITARISESCRLMNVQLDEVVRDDDDSICAPVCAASLLTEDWAEIRLYLWRGSDGCVIVEAQRRAGDAVTSYKCIRNVLDAAGRKFDAEKYNTRKEKEKKNAGIPLELMIIVEAGCGPPISNRRKASLESLEIVAGLIRNDRMDARQLGMKSLLLLSDAMRSCPESADMASRAILCFGGTDDNDMELLGSIGVDVFSMVLIGRVDDNKDCFEDEDYNKPIYNFALAALANALDRMQPLSASDVSALLTNCEDRWGCGLLSTLLNRLVSAKKSPHDACLLMRCLRLLCCASENARLEVQKLNAYETVLATCYIGRCRTARLEREATRLLKVIEK